jgi:uncharacterized protein YaaW (UPF0174 family)
MKSIDFARDDSDLYPVLQQATLVEKAFLAEIIASKHSSSIDRKERCFETGNRAAKHGGDSLMNLFRRRGVNYREIVIDVAGKVGVKIDSQGDIMKMEELIAERVIEGYKEKLSEKERDEFEKVLRESLEDRKLSMDAKNAAARSLMGMTPALLAIGGFVLRRGAVAAIPVAGQFLGALTGVACIVLAFTGAAYSVTIPSVLIIGSIRSRLAAENFAAQVEL